MAVPSAAAISVQKDLLQTFTLTILHNEDHAIVRTADDTSCQMLSGTSEYGCDCQQARPG
jgi:hypothetical protein